MSRLIQASEPTAARRRVYFHLVGTDGVTPATGEAGGQPQISTNGGAFADAGIGTLTAIGNGRYYADLTTGAVATSGDEIETRYKSGSTAECPGDSAFVTTADPASDPVVIRVGTAASGGTASIGLDAGASSVDGFYKGTILRITGGTGAGQSRSVWGYTGSSRSAFVAPNWATVPDTTSTFVLLAGGAPDNWALLQIDSGLGYASADAKKLGGSTFGVGNVGQWAARGLTMLETVNAGTSYRLTAAASVGTATQVEAQILDETDTRQVIQAIVNKINAADPDLAGLTLSAIANSVWAHADATHLLNQNDNLVTSFTGLDTDLQLFSAAFSSTVEEVTTGVYRYTAAALVNTPSSGSGLSGPSPVTLTFHDAGGSPVPSVEFTVVGQGSDRANSVGVATFGLPDGTYAVTSRMTAGTVFANTTLTVSGTTARTITGTGVAITPAVNPGQTTAHLTTWDGQGNPAPGTVIEFQLVSTDQEGSWARKSFMATSDGAALLQVTLARATTYRARRTGGVNQEWTTFTTDDASTYALPQILSPQTT